MTKLTTLDLSPFLRNSIGLDSLFDNLVGRADTERSQNYPPYNIIKKDDNNYMVEIAIAGFNDGDIDITLWPGQLIVSGEKSTVSDNEGVHVHQGIGTRKFIRTFALSEYIEVDSAEAHNGILTIHLKRNVPEEMQPKSIAISYK